MEPRAVHVYLDRAERGDAFTERSFALQGRAWGAGLRSEICAREVSSELAAFVRQVDVPPESTDDELVVRDVDPDVVKVPEVSARSLVVLSSAEDDGIKPFATAIARGLAGAGHRVEQVGVRRGDDRDLRAKVAAIPSGTDAVVVEHEFALFHDVPFLRALFSLRRRGVPSIVSIHELEPGKFHHYRLLTRSLHYAQRSRWPVEILRVAWAGLRLAARFLRYRLTLLLLGALPARIVIHSGRSRLWADLLTADASKVVEVPLVVRPLEDTALPRTAEEKRALRAKLGLPADRFVFVSPGFFFRRKRFIEVLAVAPRDAIVVLSGTEGDYADYDRGYLDEVRAYVRDRGLDNVVINTDYRTMGDHVAAADAVVLYYEDVFQSGVATQSIWAELPLVLSDLPSFRLYEAAALFARDQVELGTRMREIRDPVTYARLVDGSRWLKALLAPERLAPRYLADLTR